MFEKYEKNFNVRLDPITYQRLMAVAGRFARTSSDFARKALIEALDKAGVEVDETASNEPQDSK